MPGRSYLFVPSNRPDRFEKARNAGAEAVILDQRTRYWATTRPKPARRSPPGSPQGRGPRRDRRGERPNPRRSERAAAPRNGPRVWEARALAETPRVERLAFGSIDFQLDTGIDGEAEELLYARSRPILASRVTGILPPLDGVTAALDDPDRLAADVDRARRLGFGGKLCIHPKQIEAVNRGFVLSETEISWARRVLEAAKATGPVWFEGEMVDRPVIERERGYWREPLARIGRHRPRSCKSWAGSR